MQRSGISPGHLQFPIDRRARQRYTTSMKVRLLLFLTLLITLVACSPGHSGSNEIAFLRNGQLWTIDPDGANALAIVSSGPPVVGYTWSPTHHFLAFRTLDDTFATTPAAKQLANNPVNGQVADIQSTINSLGVDGGTPIPTAFSSPDIRYSNAIWNASGTRLIYRQTGKANPANPSEASWIVAQNDQPGGIAAKLLPAAYTIPSFSYTNQKLVAISSDGIFTTTLAGTQQHFLVRNLLPGHPLPAPLERVLWQPAHQDTHILYAVQVAETTKAHADTLQVQLTLSTMDGHTTTLTTCTCTQFAWSPDGNFILYSTGTSDALLNITTHSTFTFPVDADSIPYWSPDGRFLLLDGSNTMVIVQPTRQQQRVLLQDNHTSSTVPSFPFVPTASTLLQPAENNIWATDSRHFLFLTHNRLQWQGKALSSGQGLYSATIDDQGQVQGSPVLVDKGNDTQAGWTYQDANTSFLY
jgi:hypothetical protein